MGAVPKAVPSSVAPSTGANSVPVRTTAQLGPYQPMSGSAIVPVVPRGDGSDGADVRAQPAYGTANAGRVTVPGAGLEGAPAVPALGGLLFTSGPIDAHYTDAYQESDPYRRVNSPPARGMWTRVEAFQNHIAQAPQDVDPNGFRISPPQQRTSYMRNQLPNLGAGYAPETFTPRQQPQNANTYKYNPQTGTQPYGTGVLNSDTFGAGQTAGGIGGNQYTPNPGPPETTSTAGNPGTGNAGMPVWG